LRDLVFFGILADADSNTFKSSSVTDKRVSSGRLSVEAHMFNNDSQEGVRDQFLRVDGPVKSEPD